MMMVIILVSVASYCASTIRLAHDTSGPGTPCGSTRDCGVRLTRVRLDEVLRDVGVVW